MKHLKDKIICPEGENKANLEFANLASIVR